MDGKRQRDSRSKLGSCSQASSVLRAASSSHVPRTLYCSRNWSKRPLSSPDPLQLIGYFGTNTIGDLQELVLELMAPSHIDWGTNAFARHNTVLPIWPGTCTVPIPVQSTLAMVTHHGNSRGTPASDTKQRSHNPIYVRNHRSIWVEMLDTSHGFICP